VPSHTPPAPLAPRARRLVLSLAGVDIGPYKENLLLRRVRALAREGGFADPEGYLDQLEGGGPDAAAHARRLAEGLCIQVSGFFRDPAVFKALEELVYPGLFDEAGGRPVRVWCTACAHGQEAYSLAISLWRYARTRGREGEFAVLGTDLDEAALSRARAGVFGLRGLEGLPPELRDEAFEAEGKGAWRIRPEVRRLVRFQRADLLDFGSHPAGVDLVSCRNLLIYLQRPVQEDLILALRRALRPGGFLVLGSSETVLGRPWSLLEHLSPARRIYRRREGSPHA